MFCARIFVELDLRKILVDSIILRISVMGIVLKCDRTCHNHPVVKELWILDKICSQKIEKTIRWKIIQISCNKQENKITLQPHTRLV